MSQIITIDKGVPFPEGAKRGSMHEQYRDKLLAMEIGDSFFRINETRDDIAPLIRYAKRLNVHLMARNTDEDEIFMEPGVRAWRVEQEDLPGRKADVVKEKEAQNDTYWVNRKTGELFHCLPSVRPDDVKAKQIARIEYDLLLEAKTKKDTFTGFWYHPESDSVFMFTPGKPLDGTDGDTAMCNPISEKEFAERTVLDEKDFGGNFWKDDAGTVVVEYLPGRYPEPEEGKVRATFGEYEAFRQKQVAANPVAPKKGKASKSVEPTVEEANTFWRRRDGTCVEITPDRLIKAQNTPGAVQITEEEFRAWEDDEL